MFGAYTEQVALWSVLANMIVFVILFVSGVGRRVLKRMRQRFQHTKGGYANTLFVSKNNTAAEVFKKVDDDKSLKIDDDKYSIDRTKTILLDGIPTMLHFQGHSEPADWSDPQNAMSTGEIMQIIENNKREGFLEMLKQYYPLALVVAAVFVLLAVGSVYLNWQIFDIIVQGGTGEIALR
jgi:hypothetical protein